MFLVLACSSYMGVVVYEVLGVIVLYSLHGVFGELYVPNHDVALSVNHSA